MTNVGSDCNIACMLRLVSNVLCSTYAHEICTFGYENLVLNALRVLHNRLRKQSYIKLPCKDMHESTGFDQNESKVILRK